MLAILALCPAKPTRVRSCRLEGSISVIGVLFEQAEGRRQRLAPGPLGKSAFHDATSAGRAARPHEFAARR
jgi:hypothetical protein